MKEALSESLFIGLLMFVLARILWDWLASGRVKKGDCVSLDACERYREKCCIGEVKTDSSANKRELEAYKAELNARVSVAEKRLDEGRQSFGTSITITADDYTPPGWILRKGATVTIKGGGHVDMSGLSDADGEITAKLDGTISQFTPKTGVTVLDGAGGGTTPQLLIGGGMLSCAAYI